MSFPSSPRDAALVVEWAPFRVVPDVDDQAVIDAADAVQEEFLQQQKGYLRRELLKRADGEWVDLVYWEDQTSADAAMAAVGASRACAVYFQLMVPPPGHHLSSGVVHLRRVRAYS